MTDVASLIPIAGSEIPKFPMTFAKFSVQSKDTKAEPVVVQKHAMGVWRGNRDFLTRLKSDSIVRNALSAKLAANFDLGYRFKHVDAIIKRAFGKVR